LRKLSNFFWTDFCSCSLIRISSQFLGVHNTHANCEQNFPFLIFRNWWSDIRNNCIRITEDLLNWYW
jgi:hypothetical protein